MPAEQRRQKRQVQGQAGGSSGRCSAQACVESQDSRYYSTPACSSRARSADASTKAAAVVLCGSGDGRKFGTLKVDWEWTHYLEQRGLLLDNANAKRRQGFAGNRAAAHVSRHGNGTHRQPQQQQQQQQQRNRLLTAEAAVGHCAGCNDELKGGANWTRQAALLSLHDSALKRHEAERKRKADLAQQLLVSRAALPQVDAALFQAGRICRPEELIPLIPAAMTTAAAAAVAAVGAGGGIHRLRGVPPALVECPAEADRRRLPHSAGRKTFGRARGFVPGPGLLSRFGQGQRVAAMQEARAIRDQHSMQSSSDSVPPQSGEGVNQKPTRHINDIFRIPFDDTRQAENASQQHQNQHHLTACTLHKMERNSDRNWETKQLDEEDDKEETDEVETEEPSAAQLMMRRRAGRSVGIVSEEKKPPPPPPPQALKSTKSKPPPPPPPRPSMAASGAAMSVSGRQVQLLRRMSTVEMVVHNEDGETEEVEIDVADEEGGGGHRGSCVSSGRNSTISERINRRRNSELAADIIRLSAAHRRREFAQLLDEHRTIVRQLESLGGGGLAGVNKRANQRPPPVGTIPESSVDKDKENIDS